VDEFTSGQESKKTGNQQGGCDKKAQRKMEGISASSGQKRHAISASDPTGPQAASDLEFCRGRNRRNHHLFSIFFVNHKRELASSL
jgi:hypothetical protein